MVRLPRRSPFCRGECPDACLCPLAGAAMNETPDPRAKSPVYTAAWHPTLLMWTVCENGIPIAFCPQEATARFLAKAANILRSILSGDFFGKMIIVRSSYHHVSTRSLN